MLGSPENQRRLVAVLLIVLATCLAATLFSYDAGDAVGFENSPLAGVYQPDLPRYPPNTAPANWCGAVGALTADLLYTQLGLSAWLLVAICLSAGVILLRQKRLDTPLLRWIGGVSIIVSVSMLAAIVVPQWSPGPVIGAGGYLGAATAGFLQMHFTLPGVMILTLSLLLAGLVLAADRPLMWAARRLPQIVAIRPRVRQEEEKGDEGESPLSSDDLGDTVSPQIRRKKRRATTITGEEPSIRVRSRISPPTVEQEKEEEAAKDDNSATGNTQTPAQDEESSTQSSPTDSEGAEDLKIVRKNARRQKRLEKKQDAQKKADKATSKDSGQEPLVAKLDQAVSAASNQAIKDPGQDPSHQEQDYRLPELGLLEEGEDIRFEEQEEEVRRKAKILEQTFAEFGFTVKVVEIETGPVIAQYEIKLQAGLRLSKITGLADDLAIALRVPSVRIVAPIPGKNTVGVEVPNQQRQVVRLRDVIEEGAPKSKKMRIPIFLGKDVSGNPLVVDLSTLPHLLIAGRTGTGKSVCLNAIISSILMTRRPDEVRLLMIDPKMVELSGYASLPHLMHPVVTDMHKAEAILAWAVDKMEERYSLLARAGVRHISSYNQLGEEEIYERLEVEEAEDREAIPTHLPYIVIVADEMADLMMTAGKEVEQHIIRLAQKSRAVGIHLILATQKPTVDVITGLIKSNLPARVAFQVASRTDSRVVLDEMGADKLLGSGDMLFLSPGTSSMLRGQGTFLSDGEIKRIVDCVSTGEQHFVKELVNIKVEKPGATIAQMKKRDELYENAIDIVVREGRGSVSLLQRSLGIGYGRAARLIDYMAEDGIVGEYAGSQARDVLVSVEQWEQMQAGDAADEETSAPTQKGGKKSAKRAKNRQTIELAEDLNDADDREMENELATFEEEVDRGAELEV